MEVKPAAAVPAATKPASPFAAPPPAFAIAPNLVANAMQPANAARNTVPVFTFVMKGPLELKRLARALRGSIDRTNERLAEPVSLARSAPQRLSHSRPPSPLRAKVLGDLKMEEARVTGVSERDRGREKQ